MSKKLRAVASRTLELDADQRDLVKHTASALTVAKTLFNMSTPPPTEVQEIRDLILESEEDGETIVDQLNVAKANAMTMFGAETPDAIMAAYEDLFGEDDEDEDEDDGR